MIAILGKFVTHMTSKGSLFAFVDNLGIFNLYVRTNVCSLLFEGHFMEF